MGEIRDTGGERRVKGMAQRGGIILLIVAVMVGPAGCVLSPRSGSAFFTGDRHPSEQSSSGGGTEEDTDRPPPPPEPPPVSY